MHSPRTAIVKLYTVQVCRQAGLKSRCSGLGELKGVVHQRVVLAKAVALAQHVGVDRQLRGVGLVEGAAEGLCDGAPPRVVRLLPAGSAPHGGQSTAIHVAASAAMG